jgi:hypothetical protein
MLGIFLIICLIVYLFIKLAIHNLLKDTPDKYSKVEEPIELDSNVRTYTSCSRASVLSAYSKILILIAFLGCAWPYLFVEGVSLDGYLIGILSFGIVFPCVIIFSCYMDFKWTDSTTKISVDQIEYISRKSFSVRVDEIKKITDLGLFSYQIHLKEKSKKRLHLNFDGYTKKKELHSLIKQIEDHLAEASGRDKKFYHKFGFWGFNTFFGKYYLGFTSIAITIALFYTSYCCIDYDFFKKDYTALYNALGADSAQTENAWPHYVSAAVNYIKLEDDSQQIIEDRRRFDQLDLTDDQKGDLKKWFDQNASSWASLKKAASIDYCNAAYENISMMNSKDRNDFSTPSENGYRQIRYLYSNADAGCLAGVIDLDWFDLFQMQLTTSKHFINGKTFVDQLVGYAFLKRSIELLAKQDNCLLEDLHKAKALLKAHFSQGIPPLSIDGEIFMECSIHESMINPKTMKIPVRTPLNPMFLVFGSSSGMEAYTRKSLTAAFQRARKGIEVEPKGFSFVSFLRFPFMRNILFSILNKDVTRIYKASKRINTNLLAAYFFIDLEQYRLTKGNFPEDVSQLTDAGLTSTLPDDQDIDGKIIYCNDGQRAILYAVGKNGIDDGGYRNEKGFDKKRDDIIFWKRNY